VAKRRKAGKRAGARRKGSGGIPAWFWLLGGILIGLGTAVALMFKGYLPELKQNTPAVDSKPAPTSEAALLEDEVEASRPKKPRYDFFTVLPEMEVVVPEQELKLKAKPAPAATASRAEPGDQDKYVLQVGSFRSSSDAEERKARLAMNGLIANIQTVTVNGQTWHRVRIGPFTGARKADEVRRMLADNKIDTLVMKVNP
jgi:cell division protein FtsN